MTHGGRFHADDVFSAALLKMINPNIKILRTFQVPSNFDGLVFDIGGGKFDHHQENAPIRSNGVPYAAFGLLWREFGIGVMRTGCSAEQAAEEAEYFDETFVQPLDQDDNTGSGSQLGGMISTFNPSWDSDESPDSCFEESVAFAAVILKKSFDNIFCIQRAKSLVEAALAASADYIVILPRYAPWKNVLSGSKSEYVIYPSLRGGYSAQVVASNAGSGEAGKYFPKDWAGKPEDELKSISGVGTLTFCHKGRFLISADSLEDTIKACRIAHDQPTKD